MKVCWMLHAAKSRATTAVGIRPYGISGVEVCLLSQSGSLGLWSLWAKGCAVGNPVGGEVRPQALSTARERSDQKPGAAGIVHKSIGLDLPANFSVSPSVILIQTATDAGVGRSTYAVRQSWATPFCEKGMSPA